MTSLSDNNRYAVDRSAVMADGLKNWHGYNRPLTFVQGLYAARAIWLTAKAKYRAVEPSANRDRIWLPERFEQADWRMVCRSSLEGYDNGRKGS